MNLIGTVTNKTSGIWVHITALKAEYGPLSYIGTGSEYAIGDKVLLAGVGADEYVVVGKLRP